MPTYEFLNKETGEFVDHIMSYKDLEEFKKNNPHLLQQLSAPKVISSKRYYVQWPDNEESVFSGLWYSEKRIKELVIKRIQDADL